MPTTVPTPAPEPVRRGEPIRASQFNEVVQAVKRLGGLVIGDAGIGGRSGGVGPPSVRLDGDDGGWGTPGARAYWGRITASPGSMQRGGGVKYSARFVRRPSAVVVDLEPYYGRDWPPGTTPANTPLIIPAQVGDLCIIVREPGLEPGQRITRLWVLTERRVFRTCPNDDETPAPEEGT